MNHMKKRMLSLSLVLGLLCMVLTGCMYVGMDMNVNADGSGTLVTKAGMVPEVMEQMQASGGRVSINGVPQSVQDQLNQTNPDNMEEFVYNGVTYVGNSTTITFQNPAGLKAQLEANNQESGGNQLPLILENRDGVLTLTVTLAPSDPAQSGTGGATDPQADAMAQELLDSIVCVLDVTFPGPVQYSGRPVEGLTVQDHTIHLDMMVLAQNVPAEGMTLEFRTDGFEAGVTFCDLPETHWAFADVMAMTRQGLFKGVQDYGDGTADFAPGRTMTRAEFLTVVMRGLYPQEMAQAAPGAKWWTSAYELALSKNILNPADFDNGELEQEMSRQEMAYVLVNAGVQMGAEFVETSPDLIPDFAQVDARYGSSVLKCYERGLLTGVDQAGTFLPNGVLDRASGAAVLQRLLCMELPA